MLRVAIVLSCLALSAPAMAQDPVASDDGGEIPAPSESPAADPALEPPAAEATPAADAPAAETTAAATAEPAAASAEVLVPDAPAPKVAVVVAGDPEPRLVSAARALTAVLLAEEAIALPADAAIRSALCGEGMDDGLDDLRAARRRLGRSETADLPVLGEIGRTVRAVLVVEVRATEAGGIEAVAYDVSQMAFFDGALDLSAGTPGNAASFVARRARVAAEGAAASVEPVDEPETAPPPAEETPPAGDPVLGWLEDNWAYIAAGVLLAGGIVFVAVVATDSGPPQPMLRFTPGGP